MTEERQEVETMDKSLQVFQFEQKDIRIVMKDGEPWWVAKDVCDVLEHSNSRMALEALDEDEKGVSKVYTPGGGQEMNVINESGVYTLIMRSNKPEAKRFRKWVTSEILPQIRKTGSYSVRPDGANESMKRADAMLNNSRVRLAQFLREAVRDIWDDLSPEAKQSYSVYMVEQATGKPSPLPMPEMEKTYTAKEVGEMAEISANMVGRLANLYKLKTREYGKTVLDKSPHSSKQVPTFRYNQAGADRIVQLVKEGAVIRASDVAQM